MPDRSVLAGCDLAVLFRSFEVQAQPMRRTDLGAEAEEQESSRFMDLEFIRKSEVKKGNAQIGATAVIDRKNIAYAESIQNWLWTSLARLQLLLRELNQDA